MTGKVLAIDPAPLIYPAVVVQPPRSSDISEQCYTVIKIPNQLFKNSLMKLCEPYFHPSSFHCVFFAPPPFLAFFLDLICMSVYLCGLMIARKADEWVFFKLSLSSDK